MKFLTNVFLTISLFSTFEFVSSSFAADIPVAVDETYNGLFGENPLQPSPQSALGKYLAETHAQTFVRTFVDQRNNVTGEPRLVVTVTAANFPTFKKYFSGSSLLYLFHEPNSHNITAGFNGKRGLTARLNSDFMFTQSGVMLIPIFLNPGESQRTSQYFKLASVSKRKFDIALFPWLLKNAGGQTYMPPQNERLLSDWFMRMPISDVLDEAQVRTEYTLTGLDGLVDPTNHDLIRQVWPAPHGYRTLAQMLNLERYGPLGQFKTPGRVATMLLSAVPASRVPVVFRLIDKPLDENFNNWFIDEWDPGEEG